MIGENEKAVHSIKNFVSSLKMMMMKMMTINDGEDGEDFDVAINIL